MTGLRAPRLLALAAAVAVVTAGLSIVSAVADGRHEPGPGGRALGPGEVTVDLSIEHSRFSPDRLTVRPGTTVRFVVRNGDPIDHEFIVGDDDVHRRHESGTERSHPPVPGEVSVAPGETGETTFAFDQPGTVVFACHLPGHLAYGMQGTVTVTP